MVVVGALFFILNAGVSRVALRGGVEPAQLTTLRLSGTALLLLLVVLVIRPDAMRPRGPPNCPSPRERDPSRAARRARKEAEPRSPYAATSYTPLAPWRCRNSVVAP